MTNRVNVLGVGISALNLQSALAEIAAAISTRRKGYICVTGVHGVMEAQDDPEFMKIYDNALVIAPDGMPLVWVTINRGSGDANPLLARLLPPTLVFARFLLLVETET